MYWWPDIFCICIILRWINHAWVLSPESWVLWAWYLIGKILKWKMINKKQKWRQLFAWPRLSGVNLKKDISFFCKIVFYLITFLSVSRYPGNSDFDVAFVKIPETVSHVLQCMLFLCLNGGISYSFFSVIITWVYVTANQAMRTVNVRTPMEFFYTLRPRQNTCHFATGILIKYVHWCLTIIQLGADQLTSHIFLTIDALRMYAFEIQIGVEKWQIAQCIFYLS